MQTVTLAQLRSRARKRADMETTATPTAAQVDAEINNSIRRLHAKLAALCEDDFTTAAVVVTVAGQRWVDLPSAFLVLRAVEWLPDATITMPTILTEAGGEIDTEAGDPLYTETGEIEVSGDESGCSVDRFQLTERIRYVGRDSWSIKEPIAYRLIGRTSAHVERMEFVPTPQGRHAVRVWYVPVATTLSSDSDTYDGRSGFEEWIVRDVAATLLADEESDASVCVNERENIWATQIAPIFKARDQARPAHVIDVEGGGNRFGEWY